MTTVIGRLPSCFCVLLVEVALEVAHGLGGDAALAPLVVEVERAAVGNQHADLAALQHAVEIALPLPGLGGQRARRGGALAGVLGMRDCRSGGEKRADRRTEWEPVCHGFESRRRWQAAAAAGSMREFVSR